jgi:hypothetical protein
MKMLKLPFMFLLVSLMSLPVHASSDVTLVEIVVGQLAEKAEHHQAIASYYREKAKAARSESEAHKKMAETYRHSHVRQKKGMMARDNKMGDHCDTIVKAYESIAQQYDALAQLHEDQAKER